MINKNSRLILIPWDSVFDDPLGKRHIITVTKSMFESICCANLSVIHQDNLIGISFMSDKSLNFEKSQKELFFQKAKSKMIKFTNAPRRQQWMFGDNRILKDFMEFLNFLPGVDPNYIYLSSENIDERYSLSFHPKERGTYCFKAPDEIIICSN